MRRSITKIQRLVLFSLLLTLVSAFAMAQDQVTGNVTDSKSGVALAGVTVSLQGTSTATQTGGDGSFRITVPGKKGTLVITYVGYATQEVSINGNNAGSISLVQNNQQLNEVVVVGYGSARKKDLTGAITVVNSKDFQKGQISTPEQLIAGKVAGVSITSNGGAPGSGSVIRIRGGASLNASNDPLIVVDGVPLDNGSITGSPNPLSLINPNDIESFNILKDASATAIYGSRASNGVIIITTKRGQTGKTKVNFNTQFSVAQIANQVDVLSASEFRSYVQKEGTPGQVALLGTANTDWQKEIYQTALTYDNNISVSGAIKNKTPYRFSVGYLNQEGILKTGKLQRATVGFNISPKFLNNNLKVDLNIKASQTAVRFANTGAIGAAATFDPTQPVFSNSKRYNGYFEWLDPTTTTGLRALSPKNPVGLLNQQDDQTDTRRSIGNAVLEYKFPFFPALRANLNLGYDIAKSDGGNYINDSAASTYKRFIDAGGIPHGGLKSNFRQERKNTLMEFYLGYNRDFTAIKSKIDVIAGYSYNDFLTTNYNFSDRTSDGREIPGSQPLFPYDKPQYTLISVYGKLNYNLMNKYLLTATVRRDGSSRFNEDNRWGTFPAFALAWRIKEESFLKNSRTVSDLKLRLGYGVTGQQDGIGLYDYITYYTLSNNAAQYQLGNNYFNLFRPNGYYANRQWEQTETYNVGLDYSLFDNRVSGSIEGYLKKTTQLLNEIDQPAGTNFSNKIVANVGSMENRGVEFNINADVIKTKDLTWNVGFNATYNKNEITKLTISNNPDFKGNTYGGISGGTGTTLFINSVGLPRGSFYVYQQVYDANGKPIDGLFEDRNRDGLVNTDDLYQYKNVDPEAFFGFTTSVTYKRWNAGCVMRANVGNYVYNNVNSTIGTRNAIFGTGYLNNAYADLLNTGFTGTKSGAILSDYYIQNASFLKMDNINIGYDLGKIFKGKATLRINANVQNVFVITKYDGLDPEIQGGVDNNFYPRPRTYTIGANLDF